MEDKIPFSRKGCSIPVRPKPAHRLMPIIPVAARGAVKLRQAEQIRYAQQDHKQGIIKTLDDFFIRNAADPPQYQSKAYGQ